MFDRLIKIIYKWIFKDLQTKETFESLDIHVCDHEERYTDEFTQANEWYVRTLREAEGIWWYLNWYIDEYPDELLWHQTVLLVERSFNILAAAIWRDFFFMHTTSKENADIHITWTDNSNPLLPSLFKENTLAKAWYPWYDNWLQWKIFMNQDKSFANIFTFIAVMIHEILHLFNLKHNPDKSSLHYAVHDPENPWSILEDDILWATVWLWLDKLRNG